MNIKIIITGFLSFFIAPAQSLSYFELQDRNDSALTELYSYIHGASVDINLQKIQQYRDRYINILKIEIARLQTQKKVLITSINSILLKGCLEINAGCLLNQLCLNKISTGSCKENKLFYYTKLVALSVAEAGLFFNGVYNLLYPRVNIKAIQTRLDRAIELLTKLEAIQAEQTIN